MITDPKVGDVVYFIDAAGWSEYFDTNPSVRYQITELPEPQSSDKNADFGFHIPVRLVYLQTGAGPRRDYSYDTGVWTCWLARDEFLSQAYHAQKEAAVDCRS
jgi:hypothetical protein